MLKPVFFLNHTVFLAIKDIIGKTKQKIDSVFKSSDLTTEDEFFSNNVIGSGLSDISMLSSQEQILGQVVHRTMSDGLNINKGKSLVGACGFASWIAKKLLEKKNKDGKYTVYSHQIDDLYDKARHVFLVVQFDDGKTYIVDPTFSQFFHHHLHDRRNIPYGTVFRNHPERKDVVEQMLRYGFVEWTERSNMIYISIVLNMEMKEKDLLPLKSYCMSTFQGLDDEYTYEEMQNIRPGLFGNQ